jgi:hypothetical protein
MEPEPRQEIAMDGGREVAVDELDDDMKAQIALGRG